jgi:hypothetical protein
MYEYSENIWEPNNVNINLRQELENLKGEFSISLLYMRNCKFVRCTCFNDLNKTGNPSCPKCLGSGFFASIEKMEAIESSISKYSGNNKMEITPIGAINQKEEVYYINYKKLPKEKDYMLKVTWDSNGVPVDIVKVLEVVNIYEMRGDNGRVELYGVHVEERADLMKTYNKALHSLPKKAKMVLSKGGKYIWPYKLIR